MRDTRISEVHMCVSLETPEVKELKKVLLLEQIFNHLLANDDKQFYFVWHKNYFVVCAFKNINMTTDYLLFGPTSFQCGIFVWYKIRLLVH